MVEKFYNDNLAEESKESSKEDSKALCSECLASCSLNKAGGKKGKKDGILIESVNAGSPAFKKKLVKGDYLVKINGKIIHDIFDYMYYTQDEELLIVFKRDNKTRLITIYKEDTEDLGLNFSSYLMDDQRHCKNKCVFCFIDQMAPNLRESLYFKDDDSRLSFLFGNYITLTNLSEEEVTRIIEMKISPIYVSVHTTNPELRVKMMKNPNAGSSLETLKRFAEAGISMQCQLVLCPSLNDGDELLRSINDLKEYVPSITSVSAVPVGLTKYRDKLFPLRSFTKDEAALVVSQLEAAGEEMLVKHGIRVFFPSDEFYLCSGKKMPQEDFYEEFPQLENGVGMIALTGSQFFASLEDCRKKPKGSRITIATGVAAFPFINNLVEHARKKWDNRPIEETNKGKQPKNYTLNVEVKKIINHFFGEKITVNGLITGQDLIAQLKGVKSDYLLISESMVCDSETGDRFLDDISISDVEKALDIKVVVTSNDGADILNNLLL